MNHLGRLGVWAMVNVMTAGDSAAFAQRVETWGYGTLWVPEITARDPMVTCDRLIDAIVAWGDEKVLEALAPG